ASTDLTSPTTGNPVVVHATQVTPGQASSVQFLVTNTAGSSTTCGSNFAASGGGSAFWIGLGGAMASKPAVTSHHGGYLEVVAQRIGGWVDDIDQKSANGPWWGGRNFGAFILGAPAIISNTDGRLAVFARGGDNGLWYIEQFSPGGQWSPRAGLGGTLAS